MSTATPPSMQPPAPKKTSVWVWILGGVVIFLFAITLTCAVVGYMGMRMIKSAGFDSELMKTNPGLAMAKMVTSMNKNLEIVSSNDHTGTIVVRDKTTGKVTTMKFDPDTKKMVQITTDGDGKQSSVTIDSNGLSAQSADGSTVKYGTAAGNNVPSWVPVYPGSSPEGTVSATNGDTAQNTFTFKSKDPASKVIAFYSDQLKAAGLKINMTTTSDQGGMLQAEDEGKKRTIIVTVGTSAEGSETGVNVIEKK